MLGKGARAQALPFPDGVNGCVLGASPCSFFRGDRVELVFIIFFRCFVLMLKFVLIFLRMHYTISNREEKSLRAITPRLFDVQNSVSDWTGNPGIS